MLRQLGSGCHSLQTRYQTFQYHGSFSGTGYAGYDCQPAFGNVCFQWFYRMNLRRGKMDLSQRKQVCFCRLAAYPAVCLS